VIDPMEANMTTKTGERELLELERQYWQAMKDNDLETCLQLTDDPCIVMGPQGVSSIAKKKFTEMMQDADYTLNEFEIGDDAHVRMIDKNVAVVAYRVHEELTVEGKPVSLDAFESSTWVRRDGQWLCALHTEALRGDPFGRDRKSDGRPSS
jgi:ketosteroid isomerase-like protein